MIRRLSLISLCVVLFVGVALADGGPNHQVRTLQFGSSGSNVNDASRAFCCGGTLGSLLTDGTAQYILSNNHVLGRSGTAVAGEDVAQPGLIDNGCQVATVVADFTLAPTLGSSNVDAGIAALRTGTMDPTGSILDIGTLCSIVKAPSIGLAVAKSGRTTGFTTGAITAINTSVSVRYQAGCGKGKKFTVAYTNQVVVGGGTFSAGGDSGSLIVTNDGANQPVALLFAGSSTSTIGNPIGEVLTQVGAALGRPVVFVGGTCVPSAAALSGPVLQVAPTDVDRATKVVNARAHGMLSNGAIVGVGVGAAEDNPAEAVIVVFVDRTVGATPNVPAFLDGFRVVRVMTDPFVAF